MSFAKAGDPVTDEDGNIICYLKNDMTLDKVVSVNDFHNFTEGNTPWVNGQIYDSRCIRPNGVGGLQIRINGEWKP